MLQRMLYTKHKKDNVLRTERKCINVFLTQSGTLQIFKMKKITHSTIAFS